MSIGCFDTIDGIAFWEVLQELSPFSRLRCRSKGHRGWYIEVRYRDEEPLFVAGLVA